MSTIKRAVVLKETTVEEEDTTVVFEFESHGAPRH